MYLSWSKWTKCASSREQIEFLNDAPNYILCAQNFTPLHNLCCLLIHFLRTFLQFLPPFVHLFCDFILFKILGMQFFFTCLKDWKLKGCKKITQNGKRAHIDWNISFLTYIFHTTLWRQFSFCLLQILPHLLDLVPLCSCGYQIFIDFCEKLYK